MFENLALSSVLFERMDIVTHSITCTFIFDRNIYFLLTVFQISMLDFDRQFDLVSVVTSLVDDPLASRDKGSRHLKDCGTASSRSHLDGGVRSPFTMFCVVLKSSSSTNSETV